MPSQSALRLPEPQLSTHQLLQSIAEVTDSQDCRRFRRSLADTIRELLPVQELAFSKPVRHDGVVEYRVLFSDAAYVRRGPQRNGPTDWHTLLTADNILTMMSSGQYVAVDAHSALALLPVIHRDSLVEVVIVRALAIPQATLDVMKSFIRLYRNFRALIFESETDALTGLLNRKTLETELRQLVRDSAEQAASDALAVAGDGRRPALHPRPFLAVVDIDNFKRINDTLGHLFGDEVILLVSRLMRESFRDHDLLFRYGGEEFVIVLMAEDAAAALAALERLCLRIAQHRFPQLDQVTVSVGFVEVDLQDVVASVIGRADKALYHAKRHGKNRVTHYRDLLTSGTVTETRVFGGVDLF
ncbi:GGDEF domain-containing protein [Nevskia sp.]|uniref:GGDEF domain-containing protein n=1 Tax=Nevskia sp. TaxID=1929292 RepID=UPI0025E3733C|nr:GGDEF domain-containing protein [Nevskia sp.]